MIKVKLDKLYDTNTAPQAIVKSESNKGTEMRSVAVHHQWEIITHIWMERGGGAV